MSANSGFKDAPPTRNPSMSSFADRPGAVLALAEPQHPPRQFAQCIRNVRRNSHEVFVGPENPTFHHEYHHNFAQEDVGRASTLTSWTAAATCGSDREHSTTWRRNFLDDTRRIPTAPSGQDMFTDARNSNISRDRNSSIPVRHEELLSGMRSNYTVSGSLPQSMTTFHPPQRQDMRHLHAPPRTMHIPSTIPYGNDLNSSRNMEASIDIKTDNTVNASTSGSFNHDGASRTASFNASQSFVPETFRWRHPNGRIYEQDNRGGQPPIVAKERKPQLSTDFNNVVMHPNSFNNGRHHIPTHAQENPSDHTNISHCIPNTSHKGVKQFTARQVCQQEREQQQQKTQPPTFPPPMQPPVFQKVKGFDKLDLLCTATLEIGELYDNSTGCSCPKSKCVALYCDCFKAGRRCHPNRCSCLDCKNTIAESGIDGARTKAIRNILARNPRAFNTAGMGNPLHKLPPGEIACNCVRSKCLKLYCSCFHHGKTCRPDTCTCVGCENISNDLNGNREAAIQHVIEKRSDAFVIKPRLIGQGCACKNNKCLRKYCECYRTGLQCNPNKCTCRDCENKCTDNDSNQNNNPRTTTGSTKSQLPVSMQLNANPPASSTGSRPDPVLQQVAHV